MPERILVPLDLSERSERAVEYAAGLARHLGSSIVLVVNVNDPERSALEEFAHDERITIEQAAEAALGRVASRLASDLETTVTVRSADSPVEGILEAVEYTDSDMIVVASHGRTGMTRWLLGSVAEKLARGSDVPVLIVPTRS